MEQLSRFKYYPIPQIIEDRLTGRRYYGNRDVASLLVELDEKLMDYEKLLDDYHKLQVKYEIRKSELDQLMKVLGKYEIGSPEKLDMVLREQRVW